MAEIFGKDLFNSEYKKNAQGRLEEDVRQYNRSSKGLNHRLEMLQKQRDELSANLRRTEEVIDQLKNTPAGFKDKVETLKINLKNYQVLLDTARKESAKIAKGAGAGAAGGVAAGTAVAAFGGTALTALAMSIGTASTGTAIAGLTGAAASNAALAWLGGGAIAAGGAGMAGGEAILSLLGPLGWTIGAATLATTGIMANGKNKKAAAQMLSNDSKVQASIRATDALVIEVGKQTELMSKSTTDLGRRVTLAESNWPNDYLQFSDEEMLAAGALVNNALAAEKILNAKLGKAGKFEEATDLGATSFGKTETNSNGKFTGRIELINAGLAAVETAAGERYYFDTKSEVGSFEIGDQVTFNVAGETAKAVQKIASTEVTNKATTVPEEATVNAKPNYTDGKVGQISSLVDGIGIITTNDDSHYPFKTADATGDMAIGNLVIFKPVGGGAKEIYKA